MSERYLTLSVLESITDTCDLFSNIVCCCCWFVTLLLFVCLFVLVFYKIKFGGLKHFEVRS